MNKAERKSLRVAAELLDRVVEILFELAGDEDGDEREAPRRGRPRVIPTSAQEAEVLKLRHLNGQPGYKAIGERIKPPLPWRAVKRILDEHEFASRKDAKSSRKSSPGKQGGAP